MQLNRIFSFALVGVGIALLYVVLYLAFLHVGLVQSAANALAFGLAVMVQYAGQARFTFQRQLNDLRQMLRFGFMIACGFTTSALITGIVAPYFMLPPLIAALAVTVILPVQNFILMSLWVFSKRAI
ncbi:GtrA family protein [uncultured Sulfitobacter sp.]|uniref:GtrA family protein n=1 Tax=uncultured Sulfitobacter sp. TaxID=191468 RepID=UPI00261834FF|nr:GtrA family protein [uncultured Sulfitobacter sp.]